MIRNDLDALRAAASARGEALCALVPALRMAAVGLTRRTDEADDLVHDALLQGLLLGAEWEGRELLPELLSRMRNGFYTRTRLAGWTGAGGGDEPEGVPLALGILALPPDERAPLILVRLLGAGPELACGLCGCGEATLRLRLGRAESRIARCSRPPAADAAVRLHLHA